MNKQTIRGTLCFIFAALILGSGYTKAEEHRRVVREYHPTRDVDIIVPLLIGGAIGYSLTQPPVYQSPYVQQPVYQQFNEFDLRCNCYVQVWKQVGWR